MFTYACHVVANVIRHEDYYDALLAVLVISLHWYFWLVDASQMFNVYIWICICRSHLSSRYLTYNCTYKYSYIEHTHNAICWLLRATSNSSTCHPHLVWNLFPCECKRQTLIECVHRSCFMECFKAWVVHHSRI